MAETWFTPKEWKARLVEFAGRRLLRNVANGETVTYDVSRSEGQVSQEGDAFNTKNMNDLEQRVANGFADTKTAVDTLNRDLKVVKEHSVWEQIGTLSGTAQKIFDFSQREEICLVTTCAGNAKLVYTVKIPVVVLSEDKIHVCNGGYTAGTGVQCEWEISKTSCRLLACYVGGTNYTGSATTIYAR
jgi:hypothetical protein